MYNYNYLGIVKQANDCLFIISLHPIHKLPWTQINIYITYKYGIFQHIHNVIQLHQTKTDALTLSGPQSIAQPLPSTLWTSCQASKIP